MYRYIIIRLGLSTSFQVTPPPPPPPIIDSIHNGSVQTYFWVTMPNWEIFKIFFIVIVQYYIYFLQRDAVGVKNQTGFYESHFLNWFIKRSYLVINW